MDPEKFYTLGFSLIPNIGPVRFQKILQVFKSPQKAWQAAIRDYETSELPADILNIIRAHKEKINLEKEWENLNKQNINFICKDSAEYPKLLKEIHNAPFGLFIRGKIPDYEIAIAIVGTRKPTAYGLNIAKSISAELACQNILIVSGLALGIDTAAHLAAVEAKGKTIAVLGGGIDDKALYPPTNRKLASTISSEFGAVISEYPPATPALIPHFPARNRIISGLSQAIVVIEGELNSGSLITARFALEQNREVFAVPGNITNPNAAGPNALIKQGAHPLLSVDDIFEVLNIAQTKQNHQAKKIFPSSPEEYKIIELLSDNPAHLDDLIQSSGLDTKIINSTLTIMEMKGLVKNTGAGMYIKI